MTAIKIRPALLSDADLVARLSRETFFETFAAQNTKENMDLFMNGPFAHELLAAELKVETNYFFLAFDGDRPAGYLKLREGEIFPEFGGLPSIEIARIYVPAACAGKGIGAALMQTALALAKEKGKKWIWLGVWEKNEKAIAFYQRFGFERFGSHVFMLGTDPQTDWLMKREV